MMLGEILKTLKAEDPDTTLHNGFQNPHSYIGGDFLLAFEPVKNITIKSIVVQIESIKGTNLICCGTKTPFLITDWLDVYLAKKGESGEELGSTLLKYMIADNNRTRIGRTQIGFATQEEYRDAEKGLREHQERLYRAANEAFEKEEARKKHD